MIGADTSTVTGTLVQDHYRLEYKDIIGVDIPSNLDKVFRTEGEKSVGDEYIKNIPANADTWYYITKDGKYVSISESAISGYSTNADIYSAVVSQKIAMLVSIDFSQCENVTSDTTVTVTPQFIVGTLTDGTESFNYTRKKYDKGNVDASNANTLTVTTPTSSVYKSEKYALVADFDIPLPYNAVVELKNGTTEAIKGDCFGEKLLFKDVKDGIYTVSVSGMVADYKVTWTLVPYVTADSEDRNVLAVELASDSHSYDVSVTEPLLEITEKPTNRVYTQGEKKTLSIVYQTKGSDISAMFQKQTANGFATFELSEEIFSLDKTENTVTVNTATLEKGVYRVCISLNESSSNDDVYFTFIIF